MSQEPQELILLASARDALAKARTLDEVKDLRDRAAAIKVYAKKAQLGKHIVVEASAIPLVHIQCNNRGQLGERAAQPATASGWGARQRCAGMAVDYV